MKKSLTWWPSHWKLCALFYDAFRLHTFLSFHVYLSFHNSFMICHDNEDDDDDVLTQITATALHCPFSDSRFLCVSYDVWYTFINTIFGSKGKRERERRTRFNLSRGGKNAATESKRCVVLSQRAQIVDFSIFVDWFVDSRLNVLFWKRLDATFFGSAAKTLKRL